MDIEMTDKKGGDPGAGENISDEITDLNVGSVDAFSLKNPPRNSIKSEAKSDVKSETGLRMKYKAQSQVILEQIGSLEEVKERLNLSSRGLAQLLMVDPSAITRWTKRGDPVPPSILRALQWYLALQEKIPGLTPQYFIGKDARTHTQGLEMRFNRENSLLKEQVLLLEKSLAQQKRLLFGLFLFAVLASSAWLLRSGFFTN